MAQPEKQPQSPVAKISLAWWAELTRKNAQGQPVYSGDIAQLRRCKILEEVLFVPRYHQLYRNLAAAGYTSRLGAATIAGILAYVKQNDAIPFAKALAQPKDSGKEAKFSRLRFQRLVTCKTEPEIFTAVIRALHMLDNSTHVASLAESLYYWNDDRTRHNWTFAYYQQRLEHETNKLPTTEIARR